MKSNTKQIWIMIGVAFAVLGLIFLSYSNIQPRAYEKTSKTVSTQAQTETMATTEVQTSETKTVTYPLNINTATAQELMTIAQIGEKRAYAIVEYREHLGGYTSVEQIRDIYGIGDGIYAEIAGYLTV